MKPWSFGLLALLLVGCSQPASPTSPPLSAFTASSTALSPQGGTIILSWTGGNAPYLLSITSSSGSTPRITVNGAPYSGPTALSGSFAVLTFPPTAISQYGGALIYTLSLASGGVTKSLTLIQPISPPILAVANIGNATVAIYDLNGITSGSSPVLTLKTGPGTYPIALAFDQEGDLWVGGRICTSLNNPPTGQFLEEFKPPFDQGEPPAFSASPSDAVKSLAFDANGNLWVGERDCNTWAGVIQEYSVSSSGERPDPREQPEPR